MYIRDWGSVGHLGRVSIDTFFEPCGCGAVRLAFRYNAFSMKRFHSMHKGYRPLIRLLDRTYQ